VSLLSQVLIELVGTPATRHANGEVRTMQPRTKTAGQVALANARRKVLGKEDMDEMLGRHWGLLMRRWEYVYKEHVPSAALQLAELQAQVLLLCYTPVLPSLGCWKCIEYGLICIQQLFLGLRLEQNDDFPLKVCCRHFAEPSYRRAWHRPCIAVAVPLSNAHRAPLVPLPNRSCIGPPR
jgi:hypothetical protein